MVKRDGNADDNGKTAPLASQEELLNWKTNGAIGISNVELVSVANDKNESGRWWKKLLK